MTPGWQAELNGSGPQHKPETEEYGISSFIYRKHRPFHPERLDKLLQSGTLPKEGVMRSKGYVWVASDHLISVEWSQAGVYTTLKAGYSWLPLGFARGQWPEVAKKKFGDQLYGDRRQELVLIGTGMDETKITELLDGAILTDEEFALEPEVWCSWPKFITDNVLIPEDEGKEHEFNVNLVKKDGDRIGIQVDETEGPRISYVNPEGLVHKWNEEKTKENPDLVVRVGYNIAAVNGVRGWNCMELIGANSELQLTISRLFAVSHRQKQYPGLQLEGKGEGHTLVSDDHGHGHSDDHAHGHSHGGYGQSSFQGNSEKLE